MIRKQGLAKGGTYDDSIEWKEKRLEDEFEPFILSEKYMTEKDDRVREMDVPERIQVRLTATHNMLHFSPMHLTVHVQIVFHASNKYALTI